MRREFLCGLIGAGSAAAAVPNNNSANRHGAVSVREFGAVGDGLRLDTSAIQKAIDACTSRDGGTVVFPPGRYRSKTIVLKSNVTLHLDAGAVLLGSGDLADYPDHVPEFRSYTDVYTAKSLIYAEKAENIAITGRGRIDGHGQPFREMGNKYMVRPYLIRIVECRNVTVSDVTMENAAMWVFHLLASDDVNVRGIRIHSRINANNDGIDVDCCQRVRISDCEISSGDDSIVLKSTADRITRDVVITNCVVSTKCNGLKLGTESNGGFENIVISNCTVYDTETSGIELDMVDGGVLNGVTVSNIVMKNVDVPIFMRLGNRARPFKEGGAKPGMGKFRNVIVSNVQATGCGKRGCAITGLPGHFIEGVTLDNIRLQFVGGVKKQNREIPEFPENYPRSGMFGLLPAFGIYTRHVRGLRLRNIDLSTEQPDERPPIVMEDTTGPAPGSFVDFPAETK